MALIAGDRGRAEELLKFSKTFRHYAVEHKLWKKIAATRSGLPLKDHSLLAEFDEVFDPIRNPNFKPTVFMGVAMARFEMAVLRYKYFCSKAGEIDWQKAIKQVTR